MGGAPGGRRGGVAGAFDPAGTSYPDFAKLDSDWTLDSGVSAKSLISLARPTGIEPVFPP